jgi:dienelactone hydrolase
MRKTLLCLLSLLSYNLTFAQYNIGKKSETFIDASRSNRSIGVDIFYPATSNGNNTPIVNDVFPVIVIGHGFVMDVAAYENLSDYFVPKGYILILPKTETSFSPNHANFGLDIRYLANQILSENNNNSSFFFNKINGKVALMGHSMGGGAALLASENNTSIAAYIGLASAETSTSAIAAAANVSVPMLMLAGSADAVTPPADHQIPMYNSYNGICKTYLEFIGAGHCNFANANFNCNFGESTSGGNVTLSRAQQHGLLNKYASLFLDYYLKDDCVAWQTFNNDIRTTDSLTYNQVSGNYPQIEFSNNTLSLSGNTANFSNISWNFAGNVISNNASVNISEDGVFSVSVTLPDNCVVTNSYTVTSTFVYGDKSKNRINIYPNPLSTNQNRLSVEADLNDFNFEFYNLLGKKIYSGFSSNSEIILNEEMVKGVYILQIFEGSTLISSSKIVVN